MRDGRSFVAIMVVIAVVALILRFATEQIIKVSISQNTSTALSTLKLISTALENYARDHQGAYATGILALTKPAPPYLDRDYIALSPIKGYNYSCLRLESSGYMCLATPLICNVTGKIIYAVNTGGSLVSEVCGKKE